LIQSGNKESTSLVNKCQVLPSGKDITSVVIIVFHVGNCSSSTVKLHSLH